MKRAYPYLMFDGNCAEAMDFYEACLGGEAFRMRYADGPDGATSSQPDRLMHASLTRGEFMLMASDGMGDPPVKSGNAVWLFLDCDSDEEVRTLFAALGEGGVPVMEPHDVFWGAHFAMLRDRFGHHWMLAHNQRPQAQ